MPGPIPETDREYLIAIYGTLQRMDGQLQECRTTELVLSSRIDSLEKWRTYLTGMVGMIITLGGAFAWLWKLN
jgi:hypothetical protein